MTTDTVGAIMDSAERRMRSAGYGGFSFREIAADVGVKSASVYYHFPTKDGLVAAVARRYNDRVIEAVIREQDAGADVVQAWRTVFRNALAGGMCLCGALGITSGDLNVETAEEVRRFFVIALDSLMAGGLTRERAARIFATLEGAILMASVRGDASLFEAATASLD